MPKPLYSRILYKISGEALMGDQSFGIDPAKVSSVVDDIAEASQLGTSIALVVGGGNIFRGVALASKGADRVTGDHMGMLAIVMNALSIRMELVANNDQLVYTESSVPMSERASSRRICSASS